MTQLTDTVIFRINRDGDQGYNFHPWSHWLPTKLNILGLMGLREHSTGPTILTIEPTNSHGKAHGPISQA